MIGISKDMRFFVCNTDGYKNFTSGKIYKGVVSFGIILTTDDNGKQVHVLEGAFHKEKYVQLFIKKTK